MLLHFFVFFETLIQLVLRHFFRLGELLKVREHVLVVLSELESLCIFLFVQSLQLAKLLLTLVDSPVQIDHTVLKLRGLLL